MFLQDYEKIRLLGKGGFASVYKVRHAELGYIRALKVSNQFIEDTDDKAWQSFMEECKVLLRIGNGSHPNIVRIYQPRLLDNRAVVEMDCVEGESLSSYVRERKFVPVKEFYRFASQVIGAMAFCHVDIYRFLMNPAEDRLQPDPSDGRKYLIPPEKERELIRKYGVVHNDLHSGNIMRRDYDGQYILLDFGLAIQDTHCVKSSSRFDGAIEYCSPEKLEHGDVSTRSDVYALGILLYEMLTGQVPFPFVRDEGISPESARTKVYMAHLHETPPSIFEARKRSFESTHPGQRYERDYPEKLDRVIMKCLEKDPLRRYPDAKALLEALKTCEGMQMDVPDTDKTPAAIQEEMEALRQEVERLRKPAPSEEVVSPRPRPPRVPDPFSDYDGYSPGPDGPRMLEVTVEDGPPASWFTRNWIWILGFLCSIGFFALALFNSMPVYEVHFGTQDPSFVQLNNYDEVTRICGVLLLAYLLSWLALGRVRQTWAQLISWCLLGACIFFGQNMVFSLCDRSYTLLIMGVGILSWILWASALLAVIFNLYKK